eukprot:scaffold40784_cov75-Phaeocystis_antarctica.AAC.7
MLISTRCLGLTRYITCATSVRSNSSSRADVEAADERAMPLQESLAEFEAKAKVRREKVKADTEAKAARDLGIPEESFCRDQRCSVCTDPAVCEQCKIGSTLVQTPPARVDSPPAFDAGGWEVDEEEVSRADWPKVCQACSTGCRACDNPSPAGCTACFPMYDLGPGGCSASFKAFSMLSVVSVLVILISAYLTRLNYNKLQRIRQVRATKLAKKQSKKTR